MGIRWLEPRAELVEIANVACSFVYHTSSRAVEENIK